MPKEMGIYLFQDKFILKSLLHVKVLGCGQQFNIDGSIYIYIYISKKHGKIQTNTALLLSQPAPQVLWPYSSLFQITLRNS